MIREFAILAIGLMLAAAFSGCVGGADKTESVGPVKIVGKNATVGNVVFNIIGTNSAGVASSDVVVDIMKETITAETREDAAKRQKTVPEFTFGVNATKLDLVSKCAWDFGDGNKGEGVEAKYTFAAPGAYLVVANITLKDGKIFALNITAALNYHAEGQDSIAVMQPTQTGAGVIDDQNDYAFPVGKGALFAILKTIDDPADAALPTGKDNDVGLEAFDPKGASKGVADAGTGANEEVKVKKPKEIGNWMMRVGCIGTASSNVYADTGPVSYFFSIDVTYA
jgi:PKD repeat protein